MQKRIVQIKGMHCRSCELLIEDEVSNIPQVSSVKVSHTKGTAEIYFDGKLKDKDIEEAVSKAGYSLGIDEKTLISTNFKDYLDLLKAGVILFGLYIIASWFGFFNLSNSSGGNYSSLPIVLIVGLTAGISTCMALVGGLVLGASARFAEKHPNATTLEKFKPHLLFNIGRIISFFFFGAVIGYAGSFFQLSTTTLGFLTMAVGLVMLIMGAQLIEIFPKVKKLNFTLPKGISKLLGIKEASEKEYSHRNSLIMGTLTFFLPCGFTQAMQLYAISTGSPVVGALTMGVFAIGTAPGLLGIGGLTSLVKGALARMFFRTVGLTVIVLAFFNLSNGYNLTGWQIEFILPFSSGNDVQASDKNVTLENGVQIAQMTQNISGYNPNSFTVKKGVPVKWIINSTASGSCASTIVSSALNIRKGLQPGENVFEFTPQEVGTIKFSCIMGMYKGSFNIVDNGNSSRAISNGTPQLTNSNQSNAIVQSTPDPNAQVLKAVYTTYEDIQPNEFKVKAGQPVSLQIDAKDDGGGCMGSIAVPKLTKQIEILEKGKTVTFNFTPTKTGKFAITCAMGVPRGVISVE